jgi:hypothetical protein
MKHYPKPRCAVEDYPLPWDVLRRAAPSEGCVCR